MQTIYSDDLYQVIAMDASAGKFLIAKDDAYELVDISDCLPPTDNNLADLEEE